MLVDDLNSTLLAFEYIALRFEPSVPRVTPTAIADVVRYLTCGSALNIIQGGLTAKANKLRTILDSTPKARQGPFHPVGRGFASKDPWCEGIRRTRDNSGGASDAAKADAKARELEVRLEMTFARLFVGVAPSLEGLAATVESDPSHRAAAGVGEWADEHVRARTRLALGLHRDPGDAEVRAAKELREAVWRMDRQVIAGFSTTARLAYAIWEARGRDHGDDVADWLAAEAALREVGGP